MKILLFKKYIVIISLLFLSSCATYQAKYHSKNNTFSFNQKLPSSEKIVHTFYLIGDAGNAQENEQLTHFNLLKEELSIADKNSTVLFLGDNLYEKGMPKKEHVTRKISEHRLDAQIELVKNFKGQPIFIPGNHEYYSDGIKGLKREEEYIIENLKNKNSFLPKDGCPLKKVDISENLVLIIVDSQWYLEDWDKNPTMNDDCEIKTKERFFDEFESLIKKNATKTMVVAIHHPLFSNGSHGGQFSLRKQFYPVNNKIPLPLLGTMVNVLRKTSGISVQDMNNQLYLELKKRLITISQKADKIIFTSGHEHNLQYIFKDNIPQIVSGSGSKTSEVRAINGSQFSYGKKGYAKITVYQNGESWVQFFTEINGENNLLYTTKIHNATTASKLTSYPVKFPPFVSSSIYSKSEVRKSKLHNMLWGKHYRKYYGTSISAPTVLLDTLFGGLKPTRKGGGNQSRSLRLEDKNGKEYVMRALRKSATQYIQAVAYKDTYVEGQFENTYAENLLLDIYTTAHPYAPFSVGKLSDAINIYHPNPILYYVPKQNALKNFNHDFGDELYMIEERAADNHGDKANFGYSNKLISTVDLLEKLRETDDNTIDENSYIRARLFDMLIGDWDRHEDQWRWAEFKDGKKKIYQPVPRDRDQAFSKNDGFILGFITRAIPALKLMQVYDSNIRNVKWFNLEPYPLDMALINNSTYKNWQEQVNFIQKNITDEVIEDAFNKLPTEVNDETILEIKKKLKGRLQNLPLIAEKYYNQLSKYGVVKGTDKDNWFDIERLENGETSIKIFNIKNNKKGNKIFEKTYSKNKTKELWVYGLDDNDVFNVTGIKQNIIPLRIIGGQNNDTYNIKNDKKVTIYDYKTKKNTFTTTKGKQKLYNNYETNFYNYKKLKYNHYQLLPSIGSNPDDGIKIGINSVFTKYAFERNPFTQQHTINAAYYFSHKGFDIRYTGEFASIFNKWNFQIESTFTSPNYSINYFGFGNETINYEDEFDEDFHRVKLSTYSIAPALKWKGRFGAEFKIGAFIESIEVENTTNRFINTLDFKLDERENYTGLKSSYTYKNYDNKLFPTLGMNFTFDMGWKTNLKNSIENHVYITPSLGITHKISSNGNLVLATKMKGNLIIGDHFKFYNAASIGGLDGLRGYRNQRFIGNRSFYQNTDIRFNLRKVKTGLVPLQMGLFGGFDYGRVWLKNENSKDWKTSYGGGFWLVAAEIINLNASLFNSKDGTYFKFGLGFGF
ncbi:metallophosphoesterase [uncultured Lutibacter sp.]|uniref:metallophosphoesterase n=1 Tax=uncultured Lutibacter sp. TaxID=437739 RepID=UPI00260A9B42|nr:metallophosphoesterase [uncultured Lutibacter sp.]